jgi:hypothetical protein
LDEAGFPKDLPYRWMSRCHPAGQHCTSATQKPTAAEDTLAAKIKCQDFRKNAEGKWTSKPNTRIGQMDFSDHTFDVGEVNIGGVDLATVLNRECA